jgi:FkbM family methyltransferase
VTRPASHDAAIHFYAAFLGPSRLFFDIGANMGNRTEVFLDAGARVVCVEPQPDCVSELRRRFGDRITLVDAAVGAKVGQAQLHVATYHTLASLSPEWIEEVQASGRFSEFEWPATLEIELTTLDVLVDTYGSPDFCKIDVEGYEWEVVEGLTGPIRALSFEFTAERFESRAAAVRRLDGLGMTEFNFSFGESLEFVFDAWTAADDLVAFLSGSAAASPVSFGDVYARQPCLEVGT